MPNLSLALSYLGYNPNQHQSLVKIYHQFQIFEYDQEFITKLKEYQSKDSKSLQETSKDGDFILDDKSVQLILDSNLEIKEEVSQLVIAEKFNKLGQQKFRDLRGLGERQEMKIIALAEADQHIIQDFIDLGLTDEILPDPNCQIFFVFGATEAGLRNRIGFLEENLKEQLNGKQVIFLGGDRKLWPKYTSSDEDLVKFPGEEITYEIVKELNPQINLDELKNEINDIFSSNKSILSEQNGVAKLRNIIYAQCKEKGIIWPTESDLERRLAKDILKIDQPIIIEGENDPKISRPTTETCLKAIDTKLSELISIQPKVCFVSSQPHVKRQVELAKSLTGLKDISGCGRGAKSLLNPKNISPLLEAMLGEINSLYQIRKQQIDRVVISPRESSNVSSLGRQGISQET